MTVCCDVKVVQRKGFYRGNLVSHRDYYRKFHFFQEEWEVRIIGEGLI